MKYRIGIDVGGTFTDAVAINNETYELVGSVKLPTTHDAAEGVAAGIIQVLNKIMDDYNIKPEEVIFIAHGTTQATNALLEGDVATVGILTLGTGVEGAKSKGDTKIGDLPLAQGKSLHTINEFVNTGDSAKFLGNVQDAIKRLYSNGSQSIVVTEAFSVDNPKNENDVVEYCSKNKIPATAGNDVSKLYGLKVRTRTAVVNASILPKMLEAANMTESSIKNANIDAPLMVMRCDGGVMTVDEVRSRPILTILSGPAAGVAGALMYEKLTDGIFCEVGGTSTDISCIKDGNVMIKYAEVGGHKTYLNSLDVRTVGIGGGSMIQISGGKIVDVGPRSAHIAGLQYEVFAKPEDIINPVLKSVHPISTDPEYAYIECSNGKKYALTQSGAANICGYVKDEDYAKGSKEAAVKAWEPIAGNMGISVEQAAKKVLDLSAIKNGAVVKSLIKEYDLDKDAINFVGGGGGASTVVPHLAETFGSVSRLAKNAHVISPIGVALAMVRDMVERTISNPTEGDIISIRREAIRLATQSGANPETIEVRIEVDAQLQKVRAIAIGATELRTKDLGSTGKTKDELRNIVADNLKVEPSRVKIEADGGNLCAFSCELSKRVFFLFKKKYNTVRLIDHDGVIRLQKKNASIAQCKSNSWRNAVNKLLNENIVFGDGGAEIPNIFIAYNGRIVDLSGMQDKDQIMALCEVELAGVHEEDKLIVVCTRTTENERG